MHILSTTLCPIPQRNFDENRLIYFLIKQEKAFLIIYGNFRKISNIIKNKFNTKLIYSKKYLKAGKNTQKEAFNDNMHQ